MGTPQFGEHQKFWDRAARDDLLISILDTEETRDPTRAIEAFEQQGRVDARSLTGRVHPDATAVDLGCGIGRVLKPLADRCSRAIGVDVSEEMIARGREYVGDTANVEFVHTDGRTLPGIADESVDLFYSLLVLIHVDRRSAFHYFKEARRVLRSTGTARLQFNNILSDQGLANFEKFAATDYPLEFYTDVGLRRVLGAAGFDIVSIEASGMYWLVDAVPAPVDTWCEAFRRDVQIVDHGCDGAFDGTTFERGRTGRRWIRLAAASGSRRSLELVVALGSGERGARDAELRTEGFIALEPGVETTVEFGWNSAAQQFTLTSDRAKVTDMETVRGELPPTGPASLQLGLIPPAHGWDSATMARFPDLFELRTVELG